MRYIKIITLTFLILFSTINLLAQDGERGGIIKTDKGILIIWNEPKNNYTLEIKGNEIKPIPDKRIMFLADGKFLQLMTVPKKTFSKKRRSKTSTIKLFSRHTETGKRNIWELFLRKHSRLIRRGKNCQTKRMLSGGVSRCRRKQIVRQRSKFI